MFVANALIGLREGLEASMIVMILVAFLVKGDRRQQLKWVWLGVAVALATTTAVFVIIQFGTKTLTSTGQELVGGIASLIAVGLVTWLLLWMRTASATMSAELQGKLDKAVAIGPFAVVLLRLPQSYAKASRPPYWCLILSPAAPSQLPSWG